MNYWLKVRAIPTIALAAATTILALVLPFSALTATPSPGGATVALALVFALAMPVLQGWGVSRGDRTIERRSVRPVAILDLGLILAFTLLVTVAEMTLRAHGESPSGLVAARATVTYAGLLLASATLFGWRNAWSGPVVYFLAVVVGGRGSDIGHPAFWAWIAAAEDDALSWAVSIAVIWVGVVLYVVASSCGRFPLSGPADGGS